MPSTITRNAGFEPLVHFTIQKGLKTRECSNISNFGATRALRLFLTTYAT